jgi:hypothetical protein
LPSVFAHVDGDTDDTAWGFVEFRGCHTTNPAGFGQLVQVNYLRAEARILPEDWQLILRTKWVVFLPWTRNRRCPIGLNTHTDIENGNVILFEKPNAINLQLWVYNGLPSGYLT